MPAPIGGIGMGLTAEQDREVTFISGVTADGRVASQQFWTWNHDTPATYGGLSNEMKWGMPSAGTGASVTVGFDAASRWSADEQGAFVSSMKLWSAVANVSFTLLPDAAAAQILITRATDDTAETRLRLASHGTVGTTALGTMAKATIAIDTSGSGFGPIGAGFGVEGGFPWYTVLHEVGHSIGLGHGGAYNEGETTAEQPLGPYDNTAYSVMSYIDSPNNYGRSPDGYGYMPQTVGMLDIAAAQRIYGLPATTPLSGGQVFGYHSNIDGDLGRYYDFTRNTHPIVTLWDAGDGNTLDLSGSTSYAWVDLHQGAFSSTGGMTYNIVIADGTRIDRFVGTALNDSIVGNDDGDVLMGGGGDDAITGGTGNDHIYGNAQTSQQGATDGADRINAGDGSNYVNGNAGNDTIEAGRGTNRLYGGAGDDQITVQGAGISHVNGNTGNDRIELWGGSGDAHGGQGDDLIEAHGGNIALFGDLGSDTLSGGNAPILMIGGGGIDHFRLGNGNAVTDFDPAGETLLLPFRFGSNSSGRSGVPDTLLYGDGRSFGDDATARSYAATLIATAPMGGLSTLVVLQVGSDTHLFATEGTSAISFDVRLDHVAASAISMADFG